MKVSKLKIYSNPQETKKCSICNKLISSKWKYDICLSCLDKLKLIKEQNKNQMITK